MSLDEFHGFSEAPACVVYRAFPQNATYVMEIDYFTFIIPLDQLLHHILLEISTSSFDSLLCMAAVRWHIFSASVREHSLLIIELKTLQKSFQSRISPLKVGRLNRRLDDKFL